MRSGARSAGIGCFIRRGRIGEFVLDIPDGALLGLDVNADVDVADFWW